MNYTYERRRPVKCDICKSEMLFDGEIVISPKAGREIYVRYVCPRREKEKGCGATKMIIFKRKP